MSSHVATRSMACPVASCSSRSASTRRYASLTSYRPTAARASPPLRLAPRTCPPQPLTLKPLAPAPRAPVRCDAGDNDELSLAPAEPKTPFGEMLKYYLQMEPQLFQAAVDEKFAALQEAKAQSDAEQNDASSPTAALDLVLFRRMNEVKAREMQDTVEDLMYLSILEKFVILQVSMLPRMDGNVDVPGTNLKALTEGIHSKEALAMVKDHLTGMMGPTGNAFSTSIVKMSKLQMTQVYAASVMFGYFLRRVDKRFQLEQAFGTLEDSLSPQPSESSEETDAVERLNRIFNAASAIEPGEEEVSSSGAEGETTYKSVKRQASLKEYVESFDQATLMETAQVLTLEAAALVERQTTALFGDVKALQQQMTEAVGEDASSMEDLMQRISDAVQNDRVETLTMSVGTQRRAVLEAVAYGTFLRDIENYVDSEYQLLSEAPKATPPGMLDG